MSRAIPLLPFWVLRGLYGVTFTFTAYTTSQTLWRILGWARHIIRMEEERIPKRVLNGNFHTTRPMGRPGNRWADVVQRDALQLLG
jgi:transposase InsO family protein